MSLLSESNLEIQNNGLSLGPNKFLTVTRWSAWWEYTVTTNKWRQTERVSIGTYLSCAENTVGVDFNDWEYAEKLKPCKKRELLQKKLSFFKSLFYHEIQKMTLKFAVEALEPIYSGNLTLFKLLNPKISCFTSQNWQRACNKEAGSGVLQGKSH